MYIYNIYNLHHIWITLHRTERDMVVSGVLVPAGTTVWPIMAEVLKGDHWGDGEVFRLVLQTIDRFHNRFSPCTEKASPWLKGSTTAFTFETLSKHYNKRAWIPQ